MRVPEVNRAVIPAGVLKPPKLVARTEAGRATKFFDLGSGIRFDRSFMAPGNALPPSTASDNPRAAKVIGRAFSMRAMSPTHLLGIFEVREAAAEVPTVEFHCLRAAGLVIRHLQIAPQNSLGAVGTVAKKAFG